MTTAPQGVKIKKKLQKLTARIVIIIIFAELNFLKMKTILKIENNVDNDLARAISMDEMLNMVKEDIHEIYKNQNNEIDSKNIARSKKVLQ